MEAGDEIREAAVEQLKKRRAFRGQLAAYVFVNAVVWIIWVVIGLADDFSFPWPIFVTGGWGIAIVLQAFDVYGRQPITEQEIQDEMSRIQRRG